MKPSLVLLLVCITMLAQTLPLAAENDLDKAERLFEQGKYEEALRHHISFHDNILKTQPAMYGVRLSLATRHPKLATRLILSDFHHDQTNAFLAPLVCGVACAPKRPPTGLQTW